MKRQLDNKKTNHIIIVYLLIIFFIFNFCKKTKQNTPLFFEYQSNNEFEFQFLQIPNHEWTQKRIRIKEIHFKKNYIKTGIPINTKPTFADDGCFYFLDPFYYYNEFGFTFKYCNQEIYLNYKQFNSYINEIDESYIENLSTKSIIISKTSIDKLKQQKYIIIYNTFLKENLNQNIKNLTTHQYYFSNIFINKNNDLKEIFIPKRFYTTEYALLISSDSIDFLYEIHNKLIKISIKDKSLVDELILFFRSIEEVLNDFPVQKDFSIDMLYFDFKKLKQIRIASEENFVSITNPKNQMYLFLFPYSYLQLDLEEFEYELNQNLLTIFLEEPKTVSLPIKTKIYKQWMILKNNIFVPLELCLWKPCNIKDLNDNEFLEEYFLESTCTLNNFKLTEINPFGIYSNNTISSYGKYIEIQNDQECDNKYNKIYLNILDILIPFPEYLQHEYYLFTATENYYIYNKKIIQSKIQSYNIKEPIKLIRFFPYEEKLLFNGINENHQYFIYGDDNNQIFKKIHSIVILNKNEWEFHDYDCMGIENCSEYAMSPGYNNPGNSINKQCEISEIYIGGPKNSFNQRIPTDEFIELQCEKDQIQNKNILEIQYNNTNKIYYFPSPQNNRFVFLHDEPVCLRPLQYFVYKDLIIPNSNGTFNLNQQRFFIGTYELKKFIDIDNPVSLNYIQSFDLLLPSSSKASLKNCKGFATPAEKNQFIPYLYSNDYYNKNYVLLSSDAINEIEIFNTENQKIIQTFLKPGETISLGSDLFYFQFPYERKLLKIILDSTHIQYDEIFNGHPLCFIDTIQIQKPEYLRICFLENSHYDLKLKDNVSEIQIVPSHERIQSYPNNEYFNKLEKRYYTILKNHCMILVPPIIDLEQLQIHPVINNFTDSFLVTSNTNNIGNGLSTKEFIEIFTFKNNKKVSLCSYGIPEERLYLFENKNETTLRHISNWGLKSFTGLFHFNSY